MTDSDMDEMLKAVEDHAKTIREALQFDTVQIICSYSGPEGLTHGIWAGSGNSYARIESARSYVRRSDAEDDATINKRVMNEE